MRKADLAATTEGTPALVPGETCWRIERADRFAVIVDAAIYFAALKDAILKARHRVMLIGWDFDTRIELERDDPRPGVPDALGAFISAAVARRRDLHVYVLKWDLSLLKLPFRGTTPFYILNWINSPRLRFRLDHAHPAGACHHQKVVVIDDALAFSGGIDITLDRWDTCAHHDHNPHRLRPDGSPYGPWHDATTIVTGDAARALGDLARERWRRATGEMLDPLPAAKPIWPDGVSPVLQRTPVGIARTAPPYEGRPPVREVEALYLAAIAAARRSIYCETQYFASRRIAEALEARLREPDGPEVVIVNPRKAEGWLEEKVMGSARALYAERLLRYDRFRIYAPVTKAGADIYVHAKITIVDDRLLRVGSSNLNNRSMGLDTECDLVIEAPPGQAESGEVRRMIRSLRHALVAEHLGTTPAALQSAEGETGSLIGAIERLRGTGRTLRPLSLPTLTEAERRLAEAGLLNSDHPEPLTTQMARGTTAFPGSNHAALLTAAAILGLLGLAALGLRRRKRRVRR